MNPIDNSGDEPPPEDEDRSLLFGPPKEGGEPGGDRQKPRRARASASPPPSRTSPPAAETGADPSDPSGRTRPVAPTEVASNAVQRRILALLKDLEEKRAGLAADAAELAAVIPILSGQAEQIGAATEWVNDIKAAVSEILASTGKQIEGLKSGNKDLDGALARLKILQEGLGEVEKALGATAKGLDKRSSELGAVKQELAKYYEAWTAEAKASLREMKALSQRLDAGDHMVARLERSIGPWTDRIEKSIRENSTAQRTAAEKTAGNVEELATTGTRFLRDFDTARGEALKEARQEWTRIRRWTVPALAIALALAAPLFVFAGALGQSEFGVFDPYDDTLGWKKGVWERHGLQVKKCMRDSLRTNQVIRCSFDVDYP